MASEYKRKKRFMRFGSAGSPDIVMRHRRAIHLHLDSGVCYFGRGTQIHPLVRRWRCAMRRLQSGVLLVASCVLGCLSAAAQTTSTEILGTITDSSGALVPGAKVTLVRVATGERRVTSTTSTGSYSFPLIEVGEYTVTVAKEGFETQEKTSIEVQLQQKARVNFELTVGTATQTVAVVASGVELKTEDAAVGQVVENKR